MTCVCVSGALELKDPLCCHAFREGGRVLAHHILALGPKMDPALLQQPGGLHVVCVGSVFKAWEALKDGKNWTYIFGRDRFRIKL